MKTINVTAGIIFKNDKILIAQRKKESDQALKWEFPGGKIEQGEKPQECLKREIKEELDIDISVGELYTVVSHCYEKEKKVILHCFLCQYLKGIPKAIECHDYKWVVRSKLTGYDFAAADIPVVNKLMNDNL